MWVASKHTDPWINGRVNALEFAYHSFTPDKWTSNQDVIYCHIYGKQKLGYWCWSITDKQVNRMHSKGVHLKTAVQAKNEATAGLLFYVVRKLILQRDIDVMEDIW